jgi:acetoin utilization deacetylase AcuC-like enzyme
MQIVYNALHHVHSGRHEMFRGRLVPCHESPSRVEHVWAECQRRQLGAALAPGVWTAEREQRLRHLHTPRYLDFLAGAWDEWVAQDPANAGLDILPSLWPGHAFRTDVLPRNFSARVGLFSFDAGSPITAGTWTAAREGALCAMAAADAVRQGERAAFALSRPPGHHAGPDFFGGYCFLNNAALAAQTLRDSGLERVAVLDVDYHHGNGTQTLFEARSDVLTVSIHGDPLTEYPFYLGHADERGHGEGEGYNLNLPLPRGTQPARWFAALAQGCQAVSDYAPQALVVSLGVDTFEGDPISGFLLRSSDYLQLGRTVAALGLPTVWVFEGGYAVAEVGINTANVLEGFESA